MSKLSRSDFISYTRPYPLSITKSAMWCPIRTCDNAFVGEYIDRAKSAQTDNRPQFLTMISDAASKKFDIVIVHKLDRFARNRHDSIGYRMELKKHGVTLISALEQLDDSPESLILESVLEAMAEYYSKNLAREVRKGLLENALKCKHTGGLPPLGYDVDPIDKTLIINANEAVIIKYIFKMFIDGFGYKKIISVLNDEGYLTKARKPFGKNSIHSIIRNEKYIGVYIFNRATAKDVYGKRNNHASKDSEDVIRIENGCPAIITQDEFDIVQKKLLSRKKGAAAYKAKEVYLLSGKIKCGECGMSFGGNRKMSGRNKNLHVTYRCSNRDRTSKCTNKEIRREYLETFVLEHLAEYVFDKKFIPMITSEYKNYLLSKNSDALRLKELMAKKLKEISKEIDNIVNVISKTGSDALVSKLSELEAQKAETEFQNERLACDLNICDVSEAEIEKAFKNAVKLFKSNKLPTTKRLVELFIDKVIVYKDHVDVFYNFHPDLTPFEHTDKVFKNNKKSPAAGNAELSVATTKSGYYGGDEGS